MVILKTTDKKKSSLKNTKIIKWGVCSIKCRKKCNFLNKNNQKAKLFEMISIPNN